MNIVILVLGLLSAFGPLSIDMYLPALPGIAKDFSAPLSAVQLSLASFFVGIAAGQVFYGPLTDKYGRKKPLYVGITLYGIASFLCATTNSVDGLVIYRFVQALGSCAGMVIGRAVVRDLYKPHESAKVYSTLMLVVGVAPILAPMLGGALMSAWGWRSIFWVLCGLSFFTLFAVHFFLKETSELHPDNQLRRALHNFAGVFRDRNFTGYVFSLSFVYAGMFAYITGSPFVFIEHFKLSPGSYSLLFGANASGLIFFSQVNGRLLRHRTPERLITWALPVTLIAGVFLLIAGYLNGPVWAICIPLFFYILSMGMIAPNAAACALANQRKAAGSASALMGMVQFSLSAICSSLVSKFHNGTIFPMTAVMFGCVAVAVTSYLILLRSRLS